MPSRSRKFSSADKRSLQRIIRLDLGFEGTRYEGWQSQNKRCTIQEILEKTLLKIIPGKRTVVHGSSRTDSGVHALGYTAHFETELVLPNEKIRDALNHFLPQDIVIHRVTTAREGFHARFSAKSKVYRYDIWNSRVRPLFEAPYALWYPTPLDINLMQKAARHLVGRHDFRAFKDSGDEKKDTTRTIRNLKIQKKGSLVRILVEGDGFLTHMVRVLVGTLLEAGKSRISPSDIPAILRSMDRRKAGPTVRSHGLCLVKVSY